MAFLLCESCFGGAEHAALAGLLNESDGSHIRGRDIAADRESDIFAERLAGLH